LPTKPQGSLRLSMRPPNSPYQRDIRQTALYQEAEALFASVHQPGSGQISDGLEVSASPDGRHAVFSGTLMSEPVGAPATRICQVDLESGQSKILTFGPHIDRLPKYSPDGSAIAFLSDRHEPANFQLYRLNPETGAARPAPHVDGWVEYHHWSPDGSMILLGVAGHGADVAGGQGAIASKEIQQSLPAWMPSVQTGDETFRWRRAWVYNVSSGNVRAISNEATNIWEVVWCGNRALAAVVSPSPGEGAWYDATLQILDLETGSARKLYTPNDQLGWPSSNPSGSRLAIVEAVCSDRWIVAGELRLLNVSSGDVRRVPSAGIDITYTEWRSEDRLLVAGHRGFESVVGLYDAMSDRFTEIWSSAELTGAGRYISVAGLNEAGDIALIGEGFDRPPEIACIRDGQYRTVKPFDLGWSQHESFLGGVDRQTWEAPDGLSIQGWLLRPKGNAPYPLVMNVHGGPVWCWRPTFLGRTKNLALVMLLRRGFAVFMPNPRGSSGRGTEFTRKVKGDMNGADTHDYLSGLDTLVSRGIVDPNRIGVTGGSYGGGMTCWLISQTSRFAAAVPVAPHTNQVTEHLLSNLPHFMASFLEDSYRNPQGKYFQRSPVMHAHKVKTPTLNICGKLDRCTPPEEALQFHNALLENGVTSVLLTYPEEGHGIQKLPAALDCAARVCGWFMEHVLDARDPLTRKATT